MTSNDPYEQIMESDYALEFVERQLLKRLNKSVDKFILLYIFMLNHTYREAGEVLGVSVGKVHKRVLVIKQRLSPFATGYDFKNKVKTLRRGSRIL